jgi:hypothetical protein
MITRLQKINPPVAHQIDDAMLLGQPPRPAALQLELACFKGFYMPVKKVHLSYKAHILFQITNLQNGFDNPFNSLYLEQTQQDKIDQLLLELAKNSTLSQDYPVSFFELKQISASYYCDKRFYVYQDVVYKITEEFSDEENKLLILEFVDKERRKFEQLKNKFSGTEPEELKYLRTRIPETVRIAVWRRDQGKCAKCGGRENLEYDHIVPVSRGEAIQSEMLNCSVKTAIVLKAIV